jgi:Zn-dependent protease
MEREPAAPPGRPTDVLLEPQETPYDLRFRVFGIPVRVHPMFWLFSIILGWSSQLELVAIWVACVFVSILIHELGHVFMGMMFGTRGHIVLYSFGGLAIGSNALGTWWKRVLVSFAGPLAGFLFLAALLLGLLLAAPLYFYSFVAFILSIFGLRLPDNLPVPTWGTQTELPTLVVFALRDLVFINFFWGILNLLPIFPLDGGQISRDVATRISRTNGLRVSLGISFLLAALIAINALLIMNQQRPLIPFLPAGGIWTVILFGMLGLQSFMMLQQASSGSYHDPYDPWMGQRRPWDR